MSIEIDVLNGNTSWPAAEPLFNIVWSPEIMATVPWRDIKWAHADLRVLIEFRVRAHILDDWRPEGRLNRRAAGRNPVGRQACLLKRACPGCESSGVGWRRPSHIEGRPCAV